MVWGKQHTKQYQEMMTVVKWAGMLLLMLAIGGGIGYYIGASKHVTQGTTMTAKVQDLPAGTNEKTADEEKGQERPADTVRQIKMVLPPVQPKSLEEQAKEMSTEKAEPAAKPAEATKTVEAAKPAKAEKAADGEPEWEFYNKMDARTRDGAYYIMGLDRVEKARAGDNARKIAKRVYGGEQMSCYIEVYNGISGNEVLEEGTEVRIPKIQTKQSVKKKLQQQKQQQNK